MTVIFSTWLLAVLIMSSSAGSSSAQINTITAEPGQTVTLPCQQPVNETFIVVVWRRPELTDYVFFYRDGRSYPQYQHPSFKNRVDLRDRQMKDGDVSVILNNVTSNDTGTYECRVVWRGGDSLKIISLSVVPPGPPGGLREEGRKTDGVSRGYFGVVAVLSVISVIAFMAAIVMSLKLKKKTSPHLSLSDKKANQQLI